MKNLVLFLLLASLALFGATPLYALSGELDPDFNVVGSVTTAIGNSALAKSVAAQPDGKLIVAGQTFNGANHDILLSRYNIDGSLDAQFGVGGIVTTLIGAGDDVGTSLVLQPDGKIVVAGYSHNGTDTDFALLRYTSAGVLDTTFGGNGIVTTPIGGNDRGQGLVLQTDGMLVIAGYTHNGTNYDLALARYTNDGDLDTNFGSSGIVSMAIGSGDDFADAVALQADGKIVVVGRTNNGTNSDMMTARFTSVGALDTTFGPGSLGYVATALGSGDDWGTCLVIQPDGSLVVGGYTWNDTDNDFALVRYLSDGTSDAGFGTGGIIATPVGSGEDQAYGLTLQSDGKLVLAGHSQNGAARDLALVRYTSVGLPDTEFGDGDGIVTTALSAADDIAYAIASQEDGNLIVAGISGNDMALARYDVGPMGGLSIVGVTLRDATTLEPLSSPPSDATIIVDVTVRNIGDASTEPTELEIRDLTDSISVLQPIPGLAAGIEESLKVPFTFTGGSSCHEFEVQTLLVGGTARLSTLVPVGSDGACAASGIEVTATVTSKSGSATLTEASTILLSGFAGYKDYDTAAQGAVVTIDFHSDALNFGKIYTTHTRAPDGRWSKEILLPLGVGDYTLDVTVSDGKLTGNASQVVTVEAGSGPDLIPSVGGSGSGSYRVENTGYVLVDTDVQLSAVVYNRGVNQATGDLTVQFYFDEAAPTPDTLIDETTISIDLANDQYVRVDCPTLWTPTQIGTQGVYAIIDTSDAFAESNEGNNRASTTFGIRTPKPMLKADSIDFSHEPGPGETATIFTAIKNIGMEDLPQSSFDVSFYDITEDPEILLGTQRVDAEILRGAKATIAFEWDTTDVPIGYRYIKAVVDSADEIDEDFDYYHRASRRLDVLSLDANQQIMKIGRVDTLVVDEEGTFYASIKNRSVEPVLNDTVEFFVDGTSIGSVETGKMARGEDKTVELKLTPSVEGTIHLEGTLAETGHTNESWVYVNPLPPPNTYVYASDITVSGDDQFRHQGDSATVSAVVGESGGGIGGWVTVKIEAVPEPNAITGQREEPTQNLGSYRINLAPGGSNLVTATTPLKFTDYAYSIEVTVTTLPDEEYTSNNQANLVTKALADFPQADAGEDLSGLKGQLVSVNGSALHPASFSWTLLSKPTGSSASLTSTETLLTGLTIDVAGDYRLQLQVGNGLGYAYDQMIIHTLACLEPGQVSVPASSSTGKYSVSWGPSGTPGATYRLEENDGSGWVVLQTSTTARSYLVSNQSDGSYRYRVTAQNPASGFEDSVGATSATINVFLQCKPPRIVSVPSSSSSGSYYVQWSRSDTLGATYLLEENSGSGWSPVATGIVNNYYLISNNPSGDYSYRVTASNAAAGLADSPAISSGTISVGSTCAAPSQVTVPSSSSSGTYYVQWSRSNTLGVTYLLEEDSGSGWSSVATDIVDNYYLISNNPSGNYSYRVTARNTAAGLADSAQVVSANISVDLICAAPSQVTVPSSSSSGTYHVQWSRSNTLGATYLLEENSGSGWSSVATDIVDNYYLISNNPSGDYSYRVTASNAAAGFTDSAQVVSANITVQNLVVDGSPFDLLVTGVTGIPANGNAGDTLTVTATLNNPGDSYPNRFHYAGLYVSIDNVITKGDSLIGYTKVRRMTTGSKAVAIKGKLPHYVEPATTYYVGVIADVTDHVSESNENNNASIAYVINP